MHVHVFTYVVLTYVSLYGLVCPGLLLNKWNVCMWWTVGGDLVLLVLNAWLRSASHRWLYASVQAHRQAGYLVICMEPIHTAHAPIFYLALALTINSSIHATCKSHTVHALHSCGSIPAVHRQHTCVRLAGASMHANQQYTCMHAILYLYLIHVPYVPCIKQCFPSPLVTHQSGGALCCLCTAAVPLQCTGNWPQY